MALEEEAAKFCVKITSSDKRDISVSKQRRWFYYTEKRKRRMLARQIPVKLSLHHLSLTEHEKVESSAIL